MKAYSLFPNLEETKGLKEAQSTAHVHSAAPPSPLELAGQSPPRSRASRRDPRQASHVSALLEGSEPTLERAYWLRLARG